MGTQLPSPKRRHSPPQFSAHVCCVQTTGWMKMPLGTMVCLGPGNTVLDVDPAPPRRGTAPHFGPYLLRPNGCMDQDVTQSRRLCVRYGDHAPTPQKGAQPPKFSAHVYCGQTAGWMKLVLGMVVGLSAGEFVRWGPCPSPKRGRAPSPILRVEVENFEIGPEGGHFRL